MSHMKNRDSNKTRREDRIEQAKVRREGREARTTAEQLTKLDAGGHAAVKERIKLQQEIVAAPVVALNPVATTEVAPVEKPKKFKKGSKPKKDKKVKA
jgi:hypothetical protein